MLKKIVLGILIVLIALCAASAIALNYFAANGRVILEKELKKTFGVQPQIESLQISLPSSLVIQNLVIGDSVRIQKITAAPSFLGLIRGEVILNSIVLDKPLLKMARNSDGTWDFGIPLKNLTKENKETPQAAAPASSEPKPEPKKAKKEFYANKIKIIDAVIEFSDKTISEEKPFKAQVSRFNMDIARTSIFNPSEFQFKGTGTIEAQAFQKIGDINCSGIADFLSRDMDVTVSLDHLDLPYLGPYYKKFLKKDLQSGDIVLSAIINSKNNDLKADCHVELSNIAFKEIPPEQISAEGIEQPTDLTVLAFDSMLSSKGGAVFDFSVQTKMDDPKFEHIKLKGSFLQNTIQNAFSNPQKTAETFSKMGKDYKAIGKEFKKMFKGE